VNNNYDSDHSDACPFASLHSEMSTEYTCIPDDSASLIQILLTILTTDDSSGSDSSNSSF
jgi:hypothetical protein